MLFSVEPKFVGFMHTANEKFSQIIKSQEISHRSQKIMNTQLKTKHLSGGGEEQICISLPEFVQTGVKYD